MTTRTVDVLSVFGALLLLAMAGLHASGYPFVRRELARSELPAFLKQVLPPLYLYPSALMVLLAALVVTAMVYRRTQATVLGIVCVVAAANSILGFVLGGALPGIAMLSAAVVLGAAARQAGRRPDTMTG